MVESIQRHSNHSGNLLLEDVRCLQKQDRSNSVDCCFRLYNLYFSNPATQNGLKGNVD